MRELLSGHPLDHYGLSRRGFLRLGLGGAAGITVGQLLPGGSLRGDERTTPNPESAPPARAGHAKRCILLFMGGGASQLETFDPKPGTAIGGEHGVIPTSVPGLEINEYLPHLAKQMHRVSLIRSMDTKEGNHARAVYYLHTGYKMQGGLQHPGMGSIAGEQLGPPGFALPHYVAISEKVGHHLQGPMPTAGYLGPAVAPYLVNDIANPVKNIETWGGIEPARFSARAALRDALDAEFDGRSGTRRGSDSRVVYERAIRMMQSPLAQAFDLGREPVAVRELYGDTPSGKCMLLARRLVEAGTTFVEVLLNGWDTHGDNFKRHQQLNGHLDQPFAGLLIDLERRGLLDDTLVVWMGEFGRTPAINKGKGRDHWAKGWTVALAGGGIPDGRIVGSTDDKGHVKDRPVSCEDLYTTVSRVIGVDPRRTYYTQRERPIPAISAEGEVVEELL